MLTVINILKFPFYFLSLFSGYKTFERNPILRNTFLNKKGLHVLRVALAQRLSDARRRRLSHLIPKEQAEAYKTDGFVQVNNFLDAELFEAVLQEVNHSSFKRFDMRQGSTITRRSFIDDQDLTMLPALKKAKNDQRMLNLVRYVASYHGQPLITLQTVLAAPGKSVKKAGDPQTQLHSDTFHSTAKAWLFLTDVGEEDGPFSYVVGSHRMTAQRFKWEKEISTSIGNLKNRLSRRGSFRISAGKLEELGYPQPTPMIVKANTLVVADTHGFHARCASEKPTKRIEIYSSLRRNPFNPIVGVPFGGFHLASLPIVKTRINRSVLFGIRALNRFGLRVNPWKDMGHGPATEWPTSLGQPPKDK